MTTMPLPASIQREAISRELWGCEACRFGEDPCSCFAQRAGAPDPVPDSSSGCPYCRHGREICVCPRGSSDEDEAATAPRPGAAAEVANLLVAAEALTDPELRLHEKDMVDLPEHYARFAIEPIRFITENRLAFIPGNVIKYVMRWDAKDGVQDLKKARRYLDMLIKFVEGDRDWWRRPGDAAWGRRGTVETPPPSADGEPQRHGG